MCHFKKVSKPCDVFDMQAKRLRDCGTHGGQSFSAPRLDRVHPPSRPFNAVSPRRSSFFSSEHRTTTPNAHFVIAESPCMFQGCPCVLHSTLFGYVLAKSHPSLLTMMYALLHRHGFPDNPLRNCNPRRNQPVTPLLKATSRALC